jgi:phage/plasmid-associated DNA primase
MLLDFRDPTRAAREARPDDYQIGKFPFPFEEVFEEDPLVEDVFIKIFPYPSVREYMFYCLAYALDGSRPNESYTWLLGPGSNGKSIVNTIIGALFGEEHTGVFEPSLIQGKDISQGSIDPDRIALVHKRVAICAETICGLPLNEGSFK